MATPRYGSQNVSASNYIIVENARQGIDPRSKLSFSSNGVLATNLNNIIANKRNEPQYEIDKAVTDTIAKYYGPAAAIHDSSVRYQEAMRDVTRDAFDRRFPGQIPGDEVALANLIHTDDFIGANKFKSFSDEIKDRNEQISALDARLAEASHEVINIINETTDPLSPNAAISLDVMELRVKLAEVYSTNLPPEDKQLVDEFKNKPLSQILTVGDITPKQAQKTTHVMGVKFLDGPVMAANQGLISYRNSLPFAERVSTLQPHESLSNIIGTHISDHAKEPSLHDEVAQVFHDVQDPDSPIFDESIDTGVVTRVANRHQPENTPVEKLISDVPARQENMRAIIAHHDDHVQPARQMRASHLMNLSNQLSNSSLMNDARAGIDQRTNVRFSIDKDNDSPAMNFMERVNSPLLGSPRSPREASHYASVSLGKQLGWAVLNGRASTEVARDGAISLLEQSLDPNSKTLAIDIDEKIVDRQLNTMVSSMRGASTTKTSMREILTSGADLARRAYAQGLLNLNKVKTAFDVNTHIDREIEASQDRDLNREADTDYDY